MYLFALAARNSDFAIESQLNHPEVTVGNCISCFVVLGSGQRSRRKLDHPLAPGVKNCPFLYMARWMVNGIGQKRKWEMSALQIRVIPCISRPKCRAQKWSKRKWTEDCGQPILRFTNTGEKFWTILLYGHKYLDMLFHITSAGPTDSVQ